MGRALASLMLYLLVEVMKKMKFKRNIMTGLLGVALMATPMTVAAQDHNNGKENSRPAQSSPRSNESHASAPAHNAAPAMHNESREQHSARLRLTLRRPRIWIGMKAAKSAALAPRLTMRRPRLLLTMSHATTAAPTAARRQ